MIKGYSGTLWEELFPEPKSPRQLTGSGRFLRSGRIAALCMTKGVRSYHPPPESRSLRGSPATEESLRWVAEAVEKGQCPSERPPLESKRFIATL